MRHSEPVETIAGVHIWRAALDDPGWPAASGLPPSERDRAEAFLREEVARRWVAARWALRRVLREYIGEAAASGELEHGAAGKPRLPGSDAPEFNLSHSEGLALVAIAERPVGIDVEAIRPRRGLLALAERGLPAEDAAAVRDAAEAERPAVFHAAWTRHEARLKCLGVGLAAHPPATAPEPQNSRFSALTVEQVEVAPGYAAAVAIAGAEVGPIECRSLWAG
jgi:4'-phosphopantetheinyl transferase